MPDRPRSTLLMSILGRSLAVVSLTILGTVAGLAVGYTRASMIEGAFAPTHPTMGGEAAGIGSLIFYAYHLALSGIGGTAAGLIIGVVAAIFWPRRPQDPQ